MPGHSTFSIKIQLVQYFVSALPALMIGLLHASVARELSWAELSWTQANSGMPELHLVHTWCRNELTG